MPIRLTYPKYSMKTIQHQFVEYIPEHIQEGILYISMPFATAVHKCVCGCATEVVTPLSPKDWQLTFDGKTVTLAPSIGNWKFKCRSHYWIKKSQVKFEKKHPDERAKNAAGKALKSKKSQLVAKIQTLNIFRPHKQGK